MMMMMMMAVALTLSDLPVHWLRVWRDNLVYWAVSSSSRVASIHVLMGQRWSQALSFEVCKCLVGARGRMVMTLPADWLRKWSSNEAAESRAQLLHFIPAVTVWCFGAALEQLRRRLLRKGRTRRRRGRRLVAINLDPVWVKRRHLLTGVALVLPEYICQAGCGWISGGPMSSSGLQETPTPAFGLGGSAESACFDTSGSSVLKPDLVGRKWGWSWSPSVNIWI